MLAPSVALIILASYALALWWLLRHEQPWVFTALAVLCGASLALRVVYPDRYPWGLFEDEPKMLSCSVQAVAWGHNKWLGESCIHVPYLFMAVFGATLVPFLGATRWAIRSYPIIASVLATLAAYGAARSFGLRAAASLVAAGLVAVLPWSIFYGRIALGGELILHQALLLAGLGHLVFKKDSPIAGALVAGLGLCLLLWDYWAGRSMMAMPIVAAVLATGWRRLWCLAVIPIAVAGWIPHLSTGPQDAFVGMSLATSRGAPLAGNFNPGFNEAPLQTLINRTKATANVFVWPVAQDSIFTMRSVAMHPPALLAIAALGVLTGVRRGLFLLGGFVIGLVPGVASGSFGISAHRIMMSYIFISLAAAAAVNLPWRWPRRALAAAVIIGVAAWSVPLYFSDRFWPPDWRWTGDTDNTALAEAVVDLAPHRLLMAKQIGYYGYFDPEPAVTDIITVDNWLPADGQPTTYLFTTVYEPLRAEYQHMLPGRVRPVGQKSFLVNLEGGDWSWLRRYGWSYEVACGPRVHTAQVPFLYSVGLGVLQFPCGKPYLHTWRAHWRGPDTDMILSFNGEGAVEVGGAKIFASGIEQRLPFHVPTDSDVTIRVTSPLGEWPIAVLYERSPVGDRVPSWDEFTPVAPEPPPAAVGEPPNNGA